MTLSRTDIWLFDLETKRRTPLTLDLSKPVAPVWSPDGRSVALASDVKGRFDIYRKAADGSGPQELLYADGDDKYPKSWSPDGKFLLFDRLSAKGLSIWILPLADSGGERKPFPLAQSPLDEENGVLFAGCRADRV